MSNILFSENRQELKNVYIFIDAELNLSKKLFYSSTPQPYRLFKVAKVDLTVYGDDDLYVKLPTLIK